ncbi:MAG: ABC transporter ATP-binding protein [Gemmatimonadales bacterium]|nr:ABC transporter ATP-binding protein [Gemmatimonadales bacterium]
MIRVEGLRVRAGGFTLHDVTLEVPAGGYALVIGPTGSGKTTLLEAIAGHAPPAAGRVTIGGADVTALPPERRGVGFVYQQYHLFPHLSVRGNIGYGLRGAAGAAARVDELARLLAIAPLLDRRIAGLSGGEQQRVALARALAPRPRVLLLDEPFAAVDPATRHLLRRELRTLHEREGITTLQVTHDFDEALRLGDLVAVLADGRIAQQGPPEQVFRFPNSAFVARFVGAGNVIQGVVERLGPSEGAEGRFPARFSSPGLALDVVADREGAAHAVVRPEDLLVTRGLLPPSARNRLPATVERLERAGPVTWVHLDVGRPLLASLLSTTAEELALAPGQAVTVAVKATAVLLV